MQGTRIGRQHERRAVENAHQVAQAAAQRRCHGHLRSVEDDAFRRELSRRLAAHKHGLKPEVVPQRVRHLSPALRHPILLALACGDHDWRDGPLELVEERALCRTLVFPWSQVPRHRFVRTAECLEELEVLVLHVLAIARWQPIRGEEPVEVARARAVEAELYRCVRE